MTEEIRVRLVPKTRDAQPIAMEARGITPQLAKQLTPDAGRAREALRPAANLGISAALTRHNSLEGRIPQEEFENIFGTTLQEVTRDLTNTAPGTKESYLTATEELKIPQDLQDTIEFAYIPTPPTFFAVAAIPPNVSVYHLRLADVRRVLGGSRCHRRGWTGRNVRVAMTDSGFANHPYFVEQGYNIERVTTPTTEHPLLDDSGHGTGESANTLVMAPDCHFIGVKHDDYSALALETALEQNPQIITNSWGWDIDRQSKAQIRQSDPNFYNELIDLENIINDAIDDGIVIIFSGGNGHLAFPACIPDVLAIGGATVYQDGGIEASSYASSFASQLYPGRQVPDVCGIVGEYSPNSPLKGHIMLPVPNGSRLEGANMPNSQSRKGWGIFSGTSAAAPQTAGLVALLLQINPDLSPAQIKAIISDTATDVTKGTSGNGDDAQVGYDKATGAGFINAFQACLRTELLDSPVEQ